MSFVEADVQIGKDLFNGVGINRSCANCHNNAGANNAAGFNGNFGTNVAQMGNAPARQFDPMIPGDGGFDSAPEFEVSEMPVSFSGNGSMNAPTLVEAADTPPFFHNNAAATIEDAVRFYTTATFSTDNAFQLDDVEIDQLAAFLRAINALENVRNASVLAEDAQRQPPEQARQTIEVVIADTDDAIEVLSGDPLAPLYPDAVADLEDAYGLAEDAQRAEQPGLRNASLRQAVNLLRTAMAAGPALATRPAEARSAPGAAPRLNAIPRPGHKASADRQADSDLGFDATTVQRSQATGGRA